MISRNLFKSYKFSGALLILFLAFFIAVSNLIPNKSGTRIGDNQQVLADRMNYIPYSEKNLISSRSNGKSLLFFAATDWCTSCSALDQEIKARGNVIPGDVTVLKVDYDKDKETDRRYEIVTQHTLVLLDQNGRELKRWVGGDLNNLIKELNS